MAIKKKIFLEVGKLSENAISEDTDMALKIINHKKEVQQSIYPILTHVPDSFRSWWKQKIRWHSGITQCIVKYPKIWFRNPIPLLFPVFYIIMILFSLVYLPSELRFYEGLIHYFELLEDSSGLLPAFVTLWQNYGYFFIKKFIIGLAFVLFSLPYVAMTIKKPKEIYKIIWIIPFALFYLPLLTINFFFGVGNYFKRHSSLKKGERGW